MAKNYTFAEAVKIINEGTDLESIVDIGRRYPVLLHKVTKVCAKAGDEFVELMGFMPEYLTANKVNTALKELVTGESSGSKDTGEDDSDDENDSGSKDAGGEEKDYESMSAKQLWDILGKAGKRKLAKSTKKADLVAACKAMDAGEEPEDDKKDDDDAGEESNPYDGKTAVDLYKECKKRGIKADIKKPAKYYADLLVKDDAKSKKDEAEDDGDDWDEDESKETKSGKKDKAAGKAEKKDAKKPAKKEDDDGDDWDI